MLLEIETKVTSQTSDHRESSSWWWKLNVPGLFCGLLLAAILLVKGHYVEQTSTRPIEEFLPGHKAIVDAPKEALATDIARLNDREAKWNANDGSLEIEGIEDPLRALTNATPEQITRADYRLIKLRAYDVWPDGTLDQINVQTLQPWQWIQEHEVRVGGEAPLPLDAEEMGLDEGMRGTVLDILPCPEFEKGRGRIVLTTVNHLNRDVRELTLRDANGSKETLRPTGNHKFYSASRGEWLAASELQNGERLDGVNGDLTVVASKTIPGTHRVYNFTVQGEHLYRVANSGVLVHNNCPFRNPWTSAYRSAAVKQQHHWWPKELGGADRTGAIIGIPSKAPNLHTANGGIHPEMRRFLREELGGYETWKAATRAWVDLDFEAQKRLLQRFYESMGLDMPDMIAPGVVQ